jgi:TM2 domain-containing membrane protein YozV
MNCAHHPETPAVAACSHCKKPLCSDCSIHWQGGVICKRCLEIQGTGQPTDEPMRKSPALAALLSLMPGLGQVYVGYYRSGFINILVVVSIIMILSRAGDVVGPLLGPFLSFFWIFNMIDANRKAKLYNQHLLGNEAIQPPTDSPLALGVIFIVLGVLLTLGITFEVDMRWLEDVWPLGLLGAGIYMVWRYWQTRNEITRRREAESFELRGSAEEREYPTG